MKLLVAYLVANLAYITIGSYIFMTKQINPNFDYKSFSLALRNILVLNENMVEFGGENNEI